MTNEVAQARLWSRSFRSTTVGIFSLAFLFAFEAIAVATIMPVVARDLDGIALYAIAFSAPVAVSVVAITTAGGWIDVRGPAPALRIGVALFSAGLIAAGLAPGMLVFLAGRAMQGFGSGLAGVGLYVIIARAYPESMRARVFTVITSAWVAPALVGPVIAGAIGELVGWRWVFLGAPVFAVVSYAALVPALRRMPGAGRMSAPGGTPARDRRPSDRARVCWAAMAAAGILSLAYAGQRGVPWWPALLAISIAAVVFAAPRLLPAGTWLARPGLPSVIAVRGLIGAAFVCAEVYLPLSLVENRGFSTTQAGFVLTAAAIAWFVGSWLAANIEHLDDKVLRVRIGALCVAGGVAAVATSVDPDIWSGVAIAGWSLAGLGMGMALSTLSVLLLGHSPPGEVGANSSAMQINDAVTESLGLAIGSVVFAALLATAPTWGFVLNFMGSFAIAVLALILTRRLSN